MKKLLINEINSITGAYQANNAPVIHTFSGKHRTLNSKHHSSLEKIAFGVSAFLAVANFAFMTPNFIKRYSELKQQNQPITIKSVIFDTINKKFSY